MFRSSSPFVVDLVSCHWYHQCLLLHWTMLESKSYKMRVSGLDRMHVIRRFGMKNIGFGGEFLVVVVGLGLEILEQHYNGSML